MAAAMLSGILRNDLAAEADVRIRLSICQRKMRYSSEPDALLAAEQANVPLRHYRCERCGQFHLTSRTKGKRVPRPVW